ncbi:hypothetical protein IF1G_03134 [Cordyceps javanica]|uniref:Uncharacterized protein n=1 Tax=Cordyceps javanica TaxID=43265 RepID=A0A545W600_9HYPO|nr:hypothetical protein IF1G_03134 [Cordyceps javanica]TQW09419.1 hypothetical protein IF2G_03850 [Cordyceps javanica]
MVRYSTLAVAGLVTYTASASTAAEANTVGTGVLFHIPDRSRSSQPLTARHAAAAAVAAQCFAGQVACDASCIDGAFECCHVGQGQACQEGYSCYDQGCCRHGQTCSGPPRGCTATTKMCDIGCITRDRVCCNLGDGSSCDAGTVCLAVGLCGRPKSEAGPGSDPASASAPASASSQTSASAPGPSVVVGGAGGSSTGSGGGGGGGGSAATPLETLSDTVIDASVSSSAAMSGSGGNSPSPTTTAPASESSVPSGAPLPDKTKPTGSAGSSPTSAERGGAGETVKAPAVLAGLLVAAAYII